MLKKLNAVFATRKYTIEKHHVKMWIWDQTGPKKLHKAN